MAAGFLSTKDRTMGETLVELNDLTREDGTPYNIDRKSTRLNSSHSAKSRMPSSA